MSTAKPELFDDSTTVQMDEADDLEQVFEPLNPDALTEQDQSEWGGAMPVRWLFEASGRGKLVQLAIEQVLSGEEVFMNKVEMGEEAGTSRHSVHRHIEELVELGIYEERSKHRTRYRPNAESDILAAINATNEVMLGHEFETSP